MNKNTFSNYNLISINIENIINFCKKIYQQIKSLKLCHNLSIPINIAISNLYYMFNPEEIQSYVSRYNVNYIPAFKIHTLENINLIVLNPKKYAKKILKELEIERKFRLNLILNELTNKCIYINTKQWFKEIKPEYITEIHLAKKILQMKNNKELLFNFEYDSIISIYQGILKEIYESIPLTLYSFDTILKELWDETIVLENPEDNKNIIKNDNIYGIIKKPLLSKETINIADHYNKILYPGTGEFI